MKKTSYQTRTNYMTYAQGTSSRRNSNAVEKSLSYIMFKAFYEKGINIKLRIYRNKLYFTLVFNKN